MPAGNHAKPRGPLTSFGPDDVITATRSSNEGGRGTGDSDRSIPFRKGGVAPVKNQNAFFDAFDIKDGDKMFLAPAKRVTIW